MADGPQPRSEIHAGWPVLIFDRIDSTNDESRRQAAAGAPAGLVVVADRQDAGRGRRGRHWVSADGNLMASVLLRPAVPAARAAEISFVAGLALHDALTAVTGVAAARLTLKWPNDLLLDGSKVAGILIEAAMAGEGRIGHLVVGFGVNLRDHPSDTPYPATSVAHRLGAVVTPMAVVEALIPCLRATVTAWEQAGFAPVRTAWLARAHGLDQPIRVHQGDAVVTGVFRGVDAGGALLLAAADGSVRVIAAGDVFPDGAAA